ncbi:hypothetical protein VTL71DRAFT_2738 [Oculimacula yallundae]|uniref:Uncharacterized protein n=1 Tax=Oculimacula yallundae TaxID=86028 RepID=A0ABR4CB37_9HELO
MLPKAATRPSDPQYALFKAILMNLKTAPDVDWEAVVAESGYSSISSARERFRQHRVACGAVYGKTSRSTTTSTPTEKVVEKTKLANKNAPKKGNALGKDGKKGVVKPTEEEINPWAERYEQDKAEHGAGVAEYSVGLEDSVFGSTDEGEDDA